MAIRRPTFLSTESLRSQKVTQFPVKQNLPIAYVQRAVQSTINNIKLVVRALQDDIAYSGNVVLNEPTDKDKLILLEEEDKVILDSLLLADVVSRLESLESSVSALETSLANLDTRVIALESPPPPTEP